MAWHFHDYVAKRLIFKKCIYFGASNSIQLPHVIVSAPSIWATSYCFPGWHSQRCGIKQSQDSNPHIPVWDKGVPRNNCYVKGWPNMWDFHFNLTRRHYCLLGFHTLMKPAHGAKNWPQLFVNSMTGIQAQEKYISATSMSVIRNQIAPESSHDIYQSQHLTRSLIRNLETENSTKPSQDLTQTRQDIIKCWWF